MDASLSEQAFQRAIAPLVPVAQALGVAVVVDRETRVAGRVGADGLQIGPDLALLSDLRGSERRGGPSIVGVAGVRSRHLALELGEMQPDYLFFGRPGDDRRPEPHPKNLALAEWWASMVEIPCIVLGGSEPESVIAAAATGAEFVALERAVFGATLSPDPSSIGAMQQAASEAVARIDALLDEHAPRFDDDA